MGVWRLYPPVQMLTCAATQSTTPTRAMATRIATAIRRVRFARLNVKRCFRFITRIYEIGPSRAIITHRNFDDPLVFDLLHLAAVPVWTASRNHNRQRFPLSLGGSGLAVWRGCHHLVRTATGAPASTRHHGFSRGVHRLHPLRNGSRHAPGYAFRRRTADRGIVVCLL